MYNFWSDSHLFIVMPDSYELVSGPLSISGTKNDYDYYHHHLTIEEELVLEPGQVLGFGGAQIGYRYFQKSVFKSIHCNYVHS